MDLTTSSTDIVSIIINVINQLCTNLFSSIESNIFPLMLILILTAKPIFLLLYSERWLPSVPYFQVLCVAGIVNCLMGINTQTISAIGKSRTMFTWTIVKRVIGIGFIIGGLFTFGMKGLLCGVILNTYFSYLINIILVSKHIGYKWYKQLLDLLPVAAISIVSIAVCYYGIGYFQLEIYLDAILKTILFVAIYITLSILFKLEAYNYALSIIPAKLRFWENRIK